ncbi:HTH domain-containing protein [Halomicroarcula sp. F24A]|uniref:HTH domain-containing protein n=1 Tax=Haloarcula salinisoli TaxID=2487746 RepID=A0A8J7YFX2_9EURY|nr:HTH domain-containing protein [Halomicroarcula salinisoli]
MPGKDRDEESGEYTTSYADSDFLAAISKLDGMAGTSEIAQEVGCTRRTAYTRLSSIEEKGDVRSRQVGNSLVWIVADNLE